MICNRWIDSELEPQETYLGIEDLPGLNSDKIAAHIKVFLQCAALDIQDVRAQCCDGASAMAGQYNGVGAYI